MVYMAGGKRTRKEAEGTYPLVNHLASLELRALYLPYSYAVEFHWCELFFGVRVLCTGTVYEHFLF